MGIRLTRFIASAAALACWAVAASAAPQAGDLTGTWRNPSGSVHVDVRPCGSAMCGVVVWASANAIEDARRAGTERLIGTNLLRDFVRRPDGSWRGKAFIPDRARTIEGTIELTGPGTFKVRSCALGVICRSQVWTRLG